MINYCLALQQGVPFLFPNKKGTKEIGEGKALSVALPRAKAALPLEPIQARTWLLPYNAYSSNGDAAGDCKGGAICSERPFARLLFVLFLPKQEKNILR